MLDRPPAFDASATPTELAGAVRGAVSLSSGRLDWSVANDGDRPQPVWAARATFDLGPLPDPVRLFCHGYQSWSASRVATLGVDGDPAGPGIPGLLRQMHHADPSPAPAGDLRSELVTVLSVPGRALLGIGFTGGHEHDGTFRLRRGHDGRVALVVEAHLGGAVLAPGEQRALHAVEWEEGDDANVLLAGWAARTGAALAARTAAPYQVGWCSWYHWFTGVTEADLHDTVARSPEWPFELLQLDDGYQHDIGDWLTTNDTFPSGVAHIAEVIRGAGRTAGLWLAPFVAMGASEVAQANPGWLARWHDSRPLVGNRNPAWGGDALTLDVTQPEVLAHLEHVTRELVGMGFDYLKLDFLYAAHVQGVYADASLTPAQRVRGALEAVRRGAGPDTFLLGCGCPIGPAVGLVDGMRIGPDVDPSWGLAGWHQWMPDGYRDTPPSTRNAWQATLTRAWQHRRLWLNDPDCLMLRHEHTELTATQAATWAHAVGLSGGMALVSDDLSLLGPAEHDLLTEVVAIGREVDAAAARGHAPVVPDLLDAVPPRVIEAVGRRLVLVDPDSGESVAG